MVLSFPAAFLGVASESQPPPPPFFFCRVGGWWWWCTINNDYTRTELYFRGRNIFFITTYVFKIGDTVTTLLGALPARAHTRVL